MQGEQHETGEHYENGALKGKGEQTEKESQHEKGRATRMDKHREDHLKGEAREKGEQL